MTATTTPKTKKTTPVITEDALRGAVIRHFGHVSQLIKIAKVAHANYRVNWYQNYQVIKSAFIRVTETPDGLMIEDITIH